MVRRGDLSTAGAVLNAARKGISYRFDRLFVYVNAASTTADVNLDVDDIQLGHPMVWTLGE
jgi:hypothetical protein